MRPGLAKSREKVSLEGTEALGSWKETKGRRAGTWGKGWSPQLQWGICKGSQPECRRLGSFKILKGRQWQDVYAEINSRKMELRTDAR